MRIIFTGQTYDDSSFFTSALLSSSGVFEPDLISATSNQLVLENPDNGWVTTVTGSGFAFSSNGEEPLAGTITSISTVNGAQQQTAVLDQINWGLVEFVSAMDQATQFDNNAPLAGLFNRSGGITLDASGAGAGYDMVEFDGISDLITVPMTITGSDYRDNLFGGFGNDTINPGSNPDTGDDLAATAGNDTYDFGDAGPQSYYSLTYGRYSGLVLNWNGADGTATASTGGFTDTLLNTDQAPWGIAIDGTSAADTITVSSADDQFLQLSGGRGNDIYNLTANGGTIRVEFGYGGWEDATQGASVNLGTGVASNDGFGSVDTFNVTYGGGRIELRGTNFSDTLIGGSGRDSFITRHGNDTLNGGDGFDRVRYDRSGVESAVVDLAAETANVVIDNNIYAQTLISIEHVRGSREGDDTLLGAASNDYLEARSGDDFIDGREGNDTLQGGDGNDTLRGSDGDDRLEGESGNDTLLGGDGNDTLRGGDGDDILNPGDNNQGYDEIVAGAGDDIVNLRFMENGYADLGHWDLDAGINATINGTTNVGTIDKGANGTTTVLSVAKPMKAWGLGIVGTEFADTFDLTSVDGGYLQVEGGRGADTFNFGSGPGTLRLDYRSGSSGTDVGIVANLATGVVSNDGFGFQDTITGFATQFRATNKNDNVVGSAQDEEFYLLAGSDTLNAGGGDDRAEGGDGNDVLLGGDGNDRLEGESGNDTLLGGDGNDTLRGGDGDDILNPGDNNQGYDEIVAGAGDDIVNLRFMENGYADLGHWDLDAGINATINGTTNVGTIDKGANGTTTVLSVAKPMKAWGLGVVGTEFADTFDLTSVDGGYLQVEGGRGADTFNFGSGPGTLRLDYRSGSSGTDVGIVANLATGVVSNDGFGFQDTITGSLTQIRATMMADNIIGSARDEQFIMMAGDDTLDGGGGEDLARYDRTGVEAVTVRLDLGTADGVWRGEAFSHELSNVENVRGSQESDDVIYGDGANNYLQTFVGDDILRGKAGEDTLDGGAGADYLNGGLGGDTYFIDNVGDQVIESRRWDGVDHVYSSIDFVTGRAHIEEITLTGSDDIRAIGNGLANTIVGNAGNNILDGKKQIDTMIGGDGNDLYVVSAPGEIIIENADEGIDTVRAYRSWKLADNIENLQLKSAFDFNGVGNALDNILIGTPGDNMLFGREGNDTLRGLAGEDTFVFDRAASADNVDTIVDFTSAVDTIKIKGNLFGGLTTGTLDADAFHHGMEAADADDRLIYDSASGQLWVDADGAGGADQVLIMVLDNNEVIDASDIFIF